MLKVSSRSTKSITRKLQSSSQDAHHTHLTHYCTTTILIYPITRRLQCLSTWQTSWGYLYETTPSFIDSHFPNYVCKLHKAIYGLKQAHDSGSTKFKTFLINFGFNFSKSDPSLLIYSTNNIQMYLLIYLDDFLLTGKNHQHIQQLLSKLQSTFSLKQLDTVSMFLRIQVCRTNQGFFFHQTHYARNLLQTSSFANYKPALTPMSLKSSIGPLSDQHFNDIHLYRKLTDSP